VEVIIETLRLFHYSNNYKVDDDEAHSYLIMKL